MRLPLWVLLVCLAFLSQDSYAQFKKKKPKGNSYAKMTKKIEMQLLRNAQKNSQYVNYEQDIIDYSELLKIDSSNASYNFGMAMALYSNFEQPKSTFYFERALRHAKDTIGDAYFFLASGYHLAGNYDRAEKTYQIYYSLLIRKGSFLPKSEEIFLIADIKRRIEMCANGRILTQPSLERDSLINGGRNFYITNVGEGVNSKFDDYGAAFQGDDSMMYFTTRRPGTTGSHVDFDDKYYEDISCSNFSNHKWLTCEKLNRPVNSRKHEAIINVSRDGRRIYFYRSVDQGSFYYADLKPSGAWSKIKPLLDKQEVNTNAWETSFFGFATTVADNELFVVSDRDGGQGGRDIYVSKKKKDGTWGKLENLGPVINTKYDEDGPYITPDGNTMYFSSGGHNSMGGFDLFRSIRVDSVWAQPQNLGAPLNTPGDDVFITFLHNSNRACYSSSGYAKDSTRDMDIYMIDFCTSPNVGAIKGIAQGVSNATVTVTEKESDKEIGKYLVKDGKYIIILPLGKEYAFKFETDSIKPAITNMYVPVQCNPYDIYQEISFKKPGDTLRYTNAFFDIAKATLNAGDTSYGAYLKHVDKALLEDYSVAAVITRIKGTKDTLIETPKDTLHATIALVTDSIRHTTKTTITFKNILFDFNKAIIKDMYKPDLDTVVSYLVKTNPRDKIEVAGHTDSKGSDAYNMALSKRRANVVSVYFVNNGVGKKRMKVVGYGESMPVAPNENKDGSDNPEGRAMNRRTEIVIMNTDLGAVIDDYFEGKNVYVLKEINDLIDPDSPIERLTEKPAANVVNVKH